MFTQLEKVISIDFCSVATKLKSEILHQHHAYSFRVFATLAGMKISGSAVSLTHQ
jgi:hypothetical protein